MIPFQMTPEDIPQHLTTTHSIDRIIEACPCLSPLIALDYTQLHQICTKNLFLFAENIKILL
jgi:hypothetical protein